MVTETKNEKYNTQPAPSGTPDIPDTCRPHYYGDKSMTSDKGIRKQKMIDLGHELAVWLWKEIREGDNYKKYNLDFSDITVMMDFMYQEFFQQLYSAKYGDKTRT